MNSSKNHPLHEVGKYWSVWYMPDWYNRAYYNGNTPTARNCQIEKWSGIVESSKWIENTEHGKPYGWLVLLKLEDGSYRSIYECKCQMISGLAPETSLA